MKITIFLLINLFTVLTWAKQLQSGTYAIVDDLNPSLITQFLVIDAPASDEANGLALMVNASDQIKTKQLTGQIFQIRSIRSGDSLMLSPLHIDSMGNLAIQSELNRQAQVIEIIKAPQDSESVFPFLALGHYGALEGKLKRLQILSTERPNFRATTSNMIFKASLGNQQIVVSRNNNVGIYKNRQLIRHFQMLPINIDSSQIGILLSAKFDTMGETLVSESEVQKIGFFLTTSNGQELFFIANKSSRPGIFNFDLYGEGGESVFNQKNPGP